MKGKKIIRKKNSPSASLHQNEAKAKADIVHHRNKGTSNALQGGGVSHGGLAIYIKKKYLKAKEEEELWKTQIYFTMQKYNLQKQNQKSFQDLIIKLYN